MQKEIDASEDFMVTFLVRSAELSVYITVLCTVYGVLAVLAVGKTETKLVSTLSCF